MGSPNAYKLTADRERQYDVPGFLNLQAFLELPLAVKRGLYRDHASRMGQRNPHGMSTVLGNLLVKLGIESGRHYCLS
jgi:hypothetical protein